MLHGVAVRFVETARACDSIVCTVRCTAGYDRLYYALIKVLLLDKANEVTMNTHVSLSDNAEGARDGLPDAGAR